MTTNRPLFPGLITAISIASALSFSTPVIAAENPDTQRVSIVQDLPSPLIEILRLNASDFKSVIENKNTSVRQRAMKNQGFILGSQAGLFWHGGRMQSLIDDQSRSLDLIWDFSSLMLENGRVMPPIIGDIRGSQEITPHKRVMISRDLILDRDARFVQHAPNWRKYLLSDVFDPADIEKVNPILFPESDEYDIWETAVLKGWEAGVKQANMIMNDNIQRLSHDYIGMVRYHILFSMGMITAPFVSEKRVNVSGNEKHMSIDKRIQTMTVKPMLNLNDTSWSAVPAIRSAF